MAANESVNDCVVNGARTMAPAVTRPLADIMSIVTAAVISKTIGAHEADKGPLSFTSVFYVIGYIITIITTINNSY